MARAEPVNVVVGAASGMGAAVALPAARGPLLLADRDTDRLTATAAPLRAATMPCDLAVPAQIDALARAVDRLGALVVTAGLSPSMAAGRRRGLRRGVLCIDGGPPRACLRSPRCGARRAACRDVLRRRRAARVRSREPQLAYILAAPASDRCARGPAGTLRDEAAPSGVRPAATPALARPGPLRRTRSRVTGRSRRVRSRCGRRCRSTRRAARAARAARGPG